MTATGGGPPDTGPARAPATGSDAVRLAVDLAHIAAVRRAVAEFATWHGLSGRSRDDLVLAVNELVTNAVRHGGGSGDLRLWRAHGTILCEVADRGPGLPPEHRNGHRLPPPQASGGRGLWLVHQLCDAVWISAGVHGTTVRVVKNLG